MNITHLTSVHPRYDTRIFIKMCSSLATKYNVNLVVADGLGDEIKNSVNIKDVGIKSGSRLLRMTTTVKNVYQKAKELDSDIYHFHDPELIPIGVRLKKMGKKVIFDSHEDVERDILSKYWIPLIIRKIVSKIYMIYEKYACKKFDYIVAATPYIRDKFLKTNKHSIDINNFPIFKELATKTSWKDKKNEVCYVGLISKIRGIQEIVKAFNFTDDVRLNLGGKFSEKNVEEEVKNYDSWKNVNELGFLSRDEVVRTMSKSKVGLVTLHPIINYVDALPVKMFEYMAAGLPVIASDIKFWKEIVEGNDCGICVNPLNPKEIAKAIEYIINNPKQAERMGINGEKAILEKYNWTIEEEKLFKIYDKLK